jgi:polysaccharide pyruvyl transferase WcaK-like protein
VARAAWRRGTVFAFNAGEFVVTREYFFGLLAVAPLLAVLRIRGGRIVWLGAAARNTKRGFTFPFIWLARAADLLRWRDTASSRVIGVPGKIMPDWAFALGATGTPAERTHLAVSLRFDRERPSAEWTRAVSDLAARLGLRLITVAQVERDAPLAEELAELWRCESLPWISDRHSVQESAVRDVYARSAVVISDRLHALIIAATEGAVPLGWTTQQSTKISQHFDAVGIEGAAKGQEESVRALDQLDVQAVERRRRDVDATLIRVRAALTDVGAQLAEFSELPSRRARTQPAETTAAR